MAGCLWINPLLAQMAASFAEPEGLSVTVNMGSHPKAFSSHSLSFSKHKTRCQPKSLSHSGLISVVSGLMCIVGIFTSA